MYRKKMTKRHSKRSFRKGAGHNKRNDSRPMRGGWRM
ncbi:MAG: hypothetical protein [Arizlama microvirus]|nr:MAG: hypothetical protein [Arizlama microvirus]